VVNFLKFYYVLLILFLHFSTKREASLYLKAKNALQNGMIPREQPLAPAGRISALDWPESGAKRWRGNTGREFVAETSHASVSLVLSALLSLRLFLVFCSTLYQ
jgi:hypothetical protein